MVTAAAATRDDNELKSVVVRATTASTRDEYELESTSCNAATPNDNSSTANNADARDDAKGVGAKSPTRW